MTFRGVRPSAQPRTLRSIAEDKGTTPSGFVEGGVALGSGLPDAIRGAHETYSDHAGVPIVVAPRPAIDPAPFATLRRGR